VPEQCARRFKIFGMPLEIRCGPEMPELMRRHVNADVIRKGVSDLLAYGLLAFPPAAVTDEQMTLLVGAEARHYVAAIPSKAASNLIRHRVQLNGGRVRKALIVALARKLLIAFWKYVTAGVVLEGAETAAA
jgi:hypothetical protein